MSRYSNVPRLSFARLVARFAILGILVVSLIVLSKPADARAGTIPPPLGCNGSSNCSLCTASCVREYDECAQNGVTPAETCANEFTICVMGCPAQ